MLVVTTGTGTAWWREQSENQRTLQLLYDSYAAYVFIAIHSSFKTSFISKAGFFI